MIPRSALPPATQRRLLYCGLAAAALLLAAMAIPLLAGRVYVADDLGAYHLPIRAFYAQQLALGQAFDWLPSLFSGFYLSGEGQAGTYHPLHLLLYRFLPLTIAFDLELLLSYPLMLAGCYLLLRRWYLRRDAALLGGLAFTFSGFNLLHFIHPNAVAVVAHWPWLLWAIDGALIRRAHRDDRGSLHAACPSTALANPWPLALVSLLLGSEILIGYPQYVWLGLLFTIPYTLVRVAQCPGPRWRPLAGLLLAGVAGILLGGIQLVPTIDALSHSTRQSVDASFNSSGSLHPLNLLQIVAPYLFATRVVGQNTHELGLYFGAVPLLLCAGLLIDRRAWNDRRPLIVAALSVAGVALLLAFGEHGIGGAWQQHLPLVGKFRFPCRSIVWVYAAVALLAALGWQRLIAAPSADQKAPFTHSISAGALFGVSLLVALVVPWVMVGENAQFVAPWRWIVAGPLWFAAGAIAIGAAERGSRAAPVALLLLTLLDLGSYGLSYAVWPQTARLDDFAHYQDAPPNPDRPIVAQSDSERAAGFEVGNRLLLAGLRRADGYAGLVPARRLDCSDPVALRVAGVGFRADRTGIADSDPTRWLVVPDPLPTIRLVTRAIVDRGGLFPADALAADAALVDPATAEAPLDLTPGSPGTTSDLDNRAGRLTLATDTPGRQLLVVASAYHAGWRAMVDGQPVPVVPVNRDFLGCVVEPGKHRVTLDFHPFSLQLGRVLSTLGLGLMCAQLIVVTWLGRRRVVAHVVAPAAAACETAVH